MAGDSRTSYDTSPARTGNRRTSMAQTSVEGRTAAPMIRTELPKIVFLVLTSSIYALAPGVAPTSPLCGLEELLKQAEIVWVTTVAFGKLFAKSASNLMIIALVIFLFLLYFIHNIPL